MPCLSLLAEQTIGSSQRKQRDRELHDASPQRRHRLQQQESRNRGAHKRFYGDIHQSDYCVIVLLCYCVSVLLCFCFYVVFLTERD